MLIFMLFGAATAQSQGQHSTSKTERIYFPFSIKTNLLYDVMLIPNAGIEIDLKNRWTFGLNGMGAWWKCERKHYMWRIYGAELFARRYFGKNVIAVR